MVILFAGIIIFAIHDTLKTTASNSYIESRISEYTTAEKWDNEALPPDIPEDSAEVLFLTGMKFYAEGNTAEAEKYFKQAERKPYTDIALPVYLNIYLNECEIAETGSGNITYVQKALNHITDYPPVMHQISLIWSLVNSVMDEKNADISSQELLKEFIKNADGLKKDEVLLLETYLAVLKNINGDYSESIILFCNLWNEAQDMKESPLVAEAKSFCVDYLADMYYLYEDYDKAISLYQKQLNQDIKDPYENAAIKYASYINCGEVYLKQKLQTGKENSCRSTKNIAVSPKG